nr:hypothetical protein [Metamycoplasma auris]
MFVAIEGTKNELDNKSITKDNPRLTHKNKIGIPTIINIAGKDFFIAIFSGILSSVLLVDVACLIKITEKIKTSINIEKIAIEIKKVGKSLIDIDFVLEIDLPKIK